MSDVEHWLTTLVTEVDDTEATIEKESLSESFFAFYGNQFRGGKRSVFPYKGGLQQSKTSVKKRAPRSIHRDDTQKRLYSPFSI